VRNVAFACVLILVAARTPVVRAADEAPPISEPEGRLGTPPIVDWLRAGVAGARRLEFVEVTSAVLAHGAEGMGPGSAWFHPAQTRFGWGWLARAASSYRRW